MNSEEAIRLFASELDGISEDGVFETRLIIQKVTGLSRPVLLSHPERVLSDAELSGIMAMCEKRKTGFPLPYLLGEWEFYGHLFSVDSSVLIPRPETELMIDEALAWLKEHPDVRSGCDIGTGSGCIAVTLLLHRPDLKMAAVDLQRNALRTACKNAERHKVRDRFLPVQADLCSAFSNGLRLVCANLPYIPTETCRSIEPAKFEPLSALDGGADGFDFYRLLFRQLMNKIKDDFMILCEIEYRQKELALKTADRFFPGKNIRVLDDLSGLPRLLKITNESFK